MRKIAGLVLWLTGWKAVGEAPSVAKYIMLTAPHTSNWDGFWLVMMRWYFGLEFKWMVKDAWTRGPLGWLVRATGAIGVDRSRGKDVVDATIDLFAGCEQLALSVSPEGTRSHADRWRSGFYRIATGANVPVSLCFVDFKNRQAGFGPLLDLTGDVSADMDVIRAFYGSIQGCHPLKQSRIWLSMEELE